MTEQTRLPNLIIAGVTKAGTTSLYSYLRTHPDICASSVKETCYFLPLRYHGEELEPFSSYTRYFAACGHERYVFEATPGYFYGGAALARGIKEALGSINLIFIFRDPVDRFVSFYKYQKSMRHLDQDLSVSDYIALCQQPFDRFERSNEIYWGIEGGRYDKYIEAWLDTFNQDNIKILFFDQLKEDTRSVLIELATWLDVETAPFQSLQLTVENRSVDYKLGPLHDLALRLNFAAEKFWRANPRLKQTLREFYYALNGKPHDVRLPKSSRETLTSLFRPHNERFKHILVEQGYTKLPGWLTS